MPLEKKVAVVPLIRPDYMAGKSKPRARFRTGIDFWAKFLKVETEGFFGMIKV